MAAAKTASKSPTTTSSNQSQPNFAAYIFGGIFLGVWVYGLIFGFPDWNVFNYWSWFFWGLLGLVIAGGLYAARVTSEVVRIVIVVFVGLCIGVLILAASLEQEAHIIGTFVVATGAGLIVSALPRIEPHRG